MEFKVSYDMYVIYFVFVYNVDYVKYFIIFCGILFDVVGYFDCY